MKQWIVVIAALAMATGCGKGLRTDYGKPAAQFLAADVAAKGLGFVGQKISVKGTVTGVDASDPDHAIVTLEQGIRCDFGDLSAMARSRSEGTVAVVDGILERCAPGDILIKPALYRDPSAPFVPTP